MEMERLNRRTDVAGGKTLFNAGYRSMLALLLIWLAGDSALRSQSAVPTTTPVLPPCAYMIPALPSHVLGLLSVYGDRLHKQSGFTLTGTFTDGSGTSSSTLITEIRNRVRISMTGSQTKNLLSDDAQSTSNGAPAAHADQDVLESLQSDTPEAFFFFALAAMAFGQTGRITGTVTDDSGNQRHPPRRRPWYPCR